MDIFVDGPEQYHACFNIPVFALKRNQIVASGLKIPNCIIENLSFINMFIQ